VAAHWRTEVFLEKRLAFRFSTLYLAGMDYVLRYRGKNITVEEVEFIRELIAQNPQLSRRRLSARLAQAWNWVQANGVLRDMVCRGLMLALHRAGHIELPPPRFKALNPLATRVRPQTVPDLSWDQIQGPVKKLGPIEIRQVRRTPEEKLFASLIETHHYLAYTHKANRSLKQLWVYPLRRDFRDRLCVNPPEEDSQPIEQSHRGQS